MTASNPSAALAPTPGLEPWDGPMSNGILSAMEPAVRAITIARLDPESRRALTELATRGAEHRVKLAQAALEKDLRFVKLRLADAKRLTGLAAELNAKDAEIQAKALSLLQAEQTDGLSRDQG